MVVMVVVVYAPFLPALASGYSGNTEDEISKFCQQLSDTWSDVPSASILLIL